MSDPIRELQATKLWTYLAETDQSYAEQAIQLVSRVAPLSDTVAEYFPYFTRHDARHGAEVLRRIAESVSPRCFEADSPAAFSVADAFLLVAAAYTHDLGMTVLPGEERCGMLVGRSSDRLARYLRNWHAERGSRYVNRHGVSLGIPAPFREPVAELIRAHHLAVEDLRVQLRAPRLIEGQKVDLRQLACLFCIADALEIGQNRVFEGVIERIRADASPGVRISYFENMKHLCLGEGVRIENDGRVTISGWFFERDVWHWSLHSIRRIEAWVQAYCRIAAESPVPQLRVSHDSFRYHCFGPGVEPALCGSA